MTRRRRIVFALVAVAAAALLPLAVLLAVDMHLHTKYQTSAGFNIWGYRGPAIGRKKAGEYRVAMLGGSAAYGYGVSWEEAIPAQLERHLMAQAPAGGSFRVANLGYNNEGVYSFTSTLNDYEYLRPDLVCLYEGYNDLSGDDNGPNLSVFRHDSPVFRLTGYLPIFPIVFKEKAAAMLAGGDPGALYRSSPKTVFHPPLATRAASDVLRTAGEVGQSLERQLGRVTAESPRQIGAVDATGCKHPWGQYCRSIADAIDLAVSGHRQVLFITQPYEPGEYMRMRHKEQQHEAASMVARRFGSSPDVAYVNLGEAIDLRDPSLSFDQMHLTAAGNRRLAAMLAEPVLAMARRAAHRN
jgi:lysophospholipase L1-like esterase